MPIDFECLWLFFFCFFAFFLLQCYLSNLCVLNFEFWSCFSQSVLSLFCPPICIFLSLKQLCFSFQIIYTYMAFIYKYNLNLQMTENTHLSFIPNIVHLKYYHQLWISRLYIFLNENTCRRSAWLTPWVIYSE